MYEKHEGELVIGNAGRLTEQKGQKYLIELGKLLKAEGRKFKILIAGEGELHGPLQKLIDEEGLKNEVKLMGHVSDMPAFFNSLDVFVFTSLYEGSANTLIETLQYGVPTVAWDVSSNPEIIEDGVTGALVELGDVGGLVTKLLVVSGSPLKDQIIEQGQRKVQETFDSQINLRILEVIIKVRK